MNSQAELLKHLGVTTDQVQSTKRPPPEWFDKAIQEAQFHILSVLSNDRTSAIHWAISGEKIQEVFDKYKVTGNWRSTYRQLGMCRHGRSEISINWNHVKMNERQCYVTLLHEYVHAIQYVIFDRSGHGRQFWFYLNLLVDCFNSRNGHLELPSFSDEYKFNLQTKRKVRI